MNKLASILIGITLTGVVAGCGGHNSKTTAPESTSQGPQNHQQARDVAQQSATVATSLVEQVKSLITVVRTGTTPPRVRPLRGLLGTSDSTSWTYSIQGYDLLGNPIDWASQGDQLASLAMDYHFFLHTTADSLVLLEDVGSHTHVAGLDPVSTQYVTSANDTTTVYEDYTGSDLHYLLDYHGLSTVTNVAWMKSGTPAYPIAGTITTHWRYAYDYTSGSTHQTYSGEADATITFNGTQYATVRIGSYTFTVDLVSGVVS